MTFISYFKPPALCRWACEKISFPEDRLDFLVSVVTRSIWHRANARQHLPEQTACGTSGTFYLNAELSQHSKRFESLNRVTVSHSQTEKLCVNFYVSILRILNNLQYVFQSYGNFLDNTTTIQQYKNRTLKYNLLLLVMFVSASVTLGS